MKCYVYKQNTGVLSKNQSILTVAKTKFIIGEDLIDEAPINFRYNYYKCKDCYRLEIYLGNPKKARHLKLTTSACDYQMWVYLNKEYVYKDRGALVVDLRNIESNVVTIDLKIKKGTAITLSLEDSIGNKKIVSFVVK